MAAVRSPSTTFRLVYVLLKYHLDPHGTIKKFKKNNQYFRLHPSNDKLILVYSSRNAYIVR